MINFTQNDGNIGLMPYISFTELHFTWNPKIAIEMPDSFSVHPGTDHAAGVETLPEGWWSTSF